VTTISNLARGVGGFTSNVFLVEGERTVLVDPGNEFDVVSRVREATDGLDAVVLTHTHPDHVGNLDAVVDAFGVEVWGFDPGHPGVDHAIADGETVRLGDDEYGALHTPGHKDDHLCLYAADPGVLFAGDLVFANGGFGRTDLDEGDRETLVASIDRVLGAVDGDLRALHTGHGPSVTTNPYQDVELASRAARTR
jgi:glyoxylase-like metal-dependent hydrolase (beta-lactamase superfamily II)